MFDNHFEETQLFASDDGLRAMTPSRFAHGMDRFVDRIRLLHWTVETLATHEFSTQESNEWVWKLSEIAFEVILRDAKKAAEIANEDDMRARRTASLETLEAVKAVQRTELRAAGLDAHAIEDRV
jgi:hypothetical protein